MPKQPYIPLYTGDYLKDTRRLPLEVRGAWVDIMIFMWESKEKGTISGTMDEFALMLGCSFKKANSIISTLHEKGICDYMVLANGQIKLICRRIVRDVALSEKRKRAGSQGGNPNLLNQNSTKNKTNGYPFSDNDIDNDIKLKGEDENNVSRGRFEVDSYDNGKQAFEEIQSDEQMVERLIRVVKNEGYSGCNEVTVMKGVRQFITIEEAKPDFTRRPREDVKRHLVNWIRTKAKTLNQYV